MAMTTPTEQKRGRAVVILAVICVVLLALLAAAAVLIIQQFTHNNPSSTPAPSHSAASSPTPGTGADPDQAAKDRLAAKKMLALPASAANPQPLGDDPKAPLKIPAAATKPEDGGAPVPTGFPHTPEGALGQLAVLEEAALTGADLQRVHEVYRWAAMPGAVDEKQWNPAVAIQSMQAHSDGASIDSRYQVPSGQIKGTVGNDFVVACVLGEADIVAQRTVQFGFGDCQRMQWSQGRWRLGPGTQPATAPSAWPGSADAIRAGWRALER